MDEGTLPTYYARDAVLSYFRSKHPKGDVELPNKKMHGYGYRMMCRLFGGLIFHSPLMREFDYYMRLDGGDSRLDMVVSSASASASASPRTAVCTAVTR